VNKKRLWLSVIGLMVLVSGTAVFFLTYDFPRNIDVTHPAVQYRVNDPSSAQITTVEIQGKIHRPLFREKVFKGQIRMDGYEYTKTGGLFDVFLHENRGFLFYNAGTQIHTLGIIWIDGDFDRIHVYVFEGDRSYDLRISAPARTYEEAMQISERAGRS